MDAVAAVMTGVAPLPPHVVQPHPGPFGHMTPPHPGHFSHVAPGHFASGLYHPPSFADFFGSTSGYAERESNE